MAMPTDAPASSIPAEPAAAPQPGKSIVLFSDGTGNSSAKLFKTNVWRMYEAVDLGPPAEGKRPQISYYDDGVGTSSFKPLAALGGALGWGLKRNVLDIYRYACRNYREGDDIYAFGFSRGAFTARIVVALIASEGLVRSDNEADLQRKTVQAYRRFRKAFMPRRLEWPTKIARSLRDAVTGAIERLRDQKPYDPNENSRPKIRFIGVWDTVAAYGGPITEITRAIDNWFFPLSMPDYCLHENVVCARHALAIDDERDAFQPLLWDEVEEERLIDQGKARRGRLEQVWFTGMHADVGGGYPDESLSYVSLLWMIEQAKDADLRTLDVITDRFVALASSFGPIHNSRSGLGSYYRYQPRKIAAWLESADEKTLSLRDPEVADKRGQSRGLLRSIKVHESVINRIATGTDRYAPINLPGEFTIEPPQELAENMQQADSERSAAPNAKGVPKSLLDPRLRERLKDPGLRDARAAATERIWNRVWCRRIIYFTALFFTLALLSLPLTQARLPTPPVLGDGRTWIGGVIRLLTVFLPGFAAKFVEVYANNPFYFLLLATVIVLLMAAGTSMERKLRDNMRKVWRVALDGGSSQPLGASRVEAFRNSRGYQRFLRGLKWYALPDGVIAPLTALAIGWLALGASVQVSLPFLENSDQLCRPNSPADIVRVSHGFRTRDLCSESFGLVQKDHRYTVTFDVVQRWSDATLETSPEGLAAGDFPWGIGYFAVPLKRVIDANYLQPLVEIRRPDGQTDGVVENIQIYPLSVKPVGDSGTLFRADFRAARNGELFVFVNDAMLPYTGAASASYRYFYEASGFGDPSQRGNLGTACVTVESTDSTRSKDGETWASPSGDPVCEQAALNRRSDSAAGRRQLALASPSSR
jgi:uncharacterized protein (DUF2235 family)